MNTSNISAHLLSPRTIARTVSALALLVAGTLCMRPADAGCPQVEPVKRTTFSLQTPEPSYVPSLLPSPRSARLVHTDFRTVSDEDHGQRIFIRAEIVGLWAFRYIAEGNANKPFPINIPDGTVVDGGNTVWFADGNEMTYSGMRDPTTGSVCLGVWKQTGEHSYELNHIGLSWNPPGNPQGLPVGPGGPAFIKQFVWLDNDADSYTGTFTITQLKPDGKTLALPGVITGKIEATRVTVGTTTQVP